MLPLTSEVLEGSWGFLDVSMYFETVWIYSGISNPHKHSGCCEASFGWSKTVMALANRKITFAQINGEPLKGIRSLNISVPPRFLELSRAWVCAPTSARFGHSSRWLYSEVQCLDLDTNKMVCMKIIKNDKAATRAASSLMVQSNNGQVVKLAPFYCTCKGSTCRHPCHVLFYLHRPWLDAAFRLTLLPVVTNSVLYIYILYCIYILQLSPSTVLELCGNIMRVLH